MIKIEIDNVHPIDNKINHEVDKLINIVHEVVNEYKNLTGYNKGMTRVYKNPYSYDEYYQYLYETIYRADLELSKCDISLDYEIINDIIVLTISWKENNEN